MGWGAPLKCSRRSHDGTFVTAGIRQSSGRNHEGPLRLQIFLGKRLYEALGKPGRANVQPGTAEHAGLVRVVFDSKGASAVGRRRDGGGRFTVPLFDALPDSYCFPQTPCDLIENNGTNIVIRLPLSAWRQAITDDLRRAA